MNKQIDSQMLTYAAEILSNGGLDYLFGGQPKKVKPVNPYEDLNDGFELRPIELMEEESKNKRIVDMKYSHLYKDGVKLSDHIFRKGGLCSGFKEGYCDLIHYTRTNESKKNDNGFSFGESVIINTDGKICLTREGLDYAYHLGGNIASMGNYYYNLLTGEKICYKPSSVIKGEEYLYLEHRYNFGYYEVKIPVGVYKLNKVTLELTKIDEIK
jgi:RNA recognition motif-containing protein